MSARRILCVIKDASLDPNLGELVPDRGDKRPSTFHVLKFVDGAVAGTGRGGGGQPTVWSEHLNLAVIHHPLAHGILQNLTVSKNGNVLPVSACPINGGKKRSVLRICLRHRRLLLLFGCFLFSLTLRAALMLFEGADPVMQPPEVNPNVFHELGELFQRLFTALEQLSVQQFFIHGVPLLMPRGMSRAGY
jgi:hypothetical protein